MTVPSPLTLRTPAGRVVLVRTEDLDGALTALVPDATRAAVVERVRGAGIDRTRDLDAALVAVARAGGVTLPADVGTGWIALEIVHEGKVLAPLWPFDAPAAEVLAWLAAQAPDPAAAATTGDRIRAWIGREAEAEENPVDVALAARAYLAVRAIEADRRRPFMALDAGTAHHALLSGMRDLPKSRKKTHASTVRDGWAEILHPGQQLGLRLDLRELPERIITAVRAWRSWQGLRHWAALQCLFTDAGRTGRIRWTLDGHLKALGYADDARRDPAVRKTVAAEVEALTQMEVAVYHPDGTLRARGPVLGIVQRGEALHGAEWRLEGLELVIHPVLYEGVRRGDGSVGRLWAPAPVELARINHGSFPHALALGLILPIRWRWDTADGRDHVTLKGQKLLEAAGIGLDPRKPGRAWATLARNLAALQRAGGLGHVAWDADVTNTPTGVCRLYPPQWVRERLVHGIAPVELPPAPQLLTGAELAAWRKTKGWSQASAATALGVGVATLKRAEAAPDARLGRALIDALARHR